MKEMEAVRVAQSGTKRSEHESLEANFKTSQMLLSQQKWETRSLHSPNHYCIRREVFQLLE